MIADSAKDENISNMLNLTVQDKMGLFPEEFLEDLAEISPYLIEYEPNKTFFEWFITCYWGKKCGIFITSKKSRQVVLNHLRNIFSVQDESGRELFFRYYDPEILQTYFSTCTHKESETFFGPLDAFIFEDKNQRLAYITSQDSRIPG